MKSWSQAHRRPSHSWFFVHSYRWLLILLLALLGFPQAPARAQSSASGGFGQGLGASAPVRAMALQPDGKILIGGVFEVGGNTGIARLLSDGARDTTFQAVAGGTVHAIAVQPDGKILVGGSFQDMNGQLLGGLARLNLDGTLDDTFVARVGGGVFSIVQQPDGKLLIGGMFSEVNGQSHKNIVRLNSDGTLDTTFDARWGSAGGWVTVLAVQGDDKVLVGGHFDSMNGLPRSNIARFNPTGSLDESFTPGTNGDVLSIVVQPDDKIVVGGIFTLLVGAERDSVGRLNPDGTLDGSLGYQAMDSGVNSLVVQGDGTLLVGGSFTFYDQQRRPAIARIKLDGTRDASFNAYPNAAINVVAVQPDGQVMIAGDFTQVNGQTRNRLARLNPDGSLEGAMRIDAEFHGQPVDAVRASGMQQDGKIVIGSLQYDQATGKALIRLMPDGSYDTSFDVRLTHPEHPKPNVALVIAVAVQPDGKILFGGDFSQIEAGGVTHTSRRLARLNPDGTIDRSFSVDLQGGIVYAITLQPDGKILIVGDFQFVNGQRQLGLARLNDDGTRDTFFAPTIVSGTIRSVVLQPDGKILAGGNIREVNYITRRGLARFNPDGTFDTAFDARLGVYYGDVAVYGVVVQADGKLVIGGIFNSVRGWSRDHIARINSDGTLDRTFAPYNRSYIYSMAPRADGSVVIADGSGRIRVVHSDGTEGYTLQTNGQFLPTNAIAVQPDGNLLVGGGFSQVDGQPHNRIVRLFGLGPLN